MTTPANTLRDETAPEKTTRDRTKRAAMMKATPTSLRSPRRDAACAQALRVAALTLAVGVAAAAPSVSAQTPAQAPTAQTSPGCALTGSPNVFFEGRPALRLSDVAACPGLRYEVLPGIFINGEPAVRLLPSEDCAVDGADSVFADGGAAARVGDAACAPR